MVTERINFLRMDSKMDKQYWLVGATYGNEGDQAENFVSGGYWMLGWKENDAPLQMTRCNKIRPGDRIAIKTTRTRGYTNDNSVCRDCKGNNTL